MNPRVRSTRMSPAVAALSLASTLAALGGCAMNPIPTEVPNAQTIAGLEPSGRVVMTEVFAGGAGVGTGALAFRGKTYPFKLVGTVVGPGVVQKLDVAGEVYKLEDIKQFSGPFVEGTGGIGLENVGEGRPLAPEQGRRRHAPDRYPDRRGPQPRPRRDSHRAREAEVVRGPVSVPDRLSGETPPLPSRADCAMTAPNRSRVP